jgi:hydrogenase nickel incorporation protein HypA/HybF
MHELALAQSIVDIVGEEATRHGLAQIEAIRLRVGVFRAVVPELLQTCMEIAGRGTVAEGARVDLEVVGGRARCPDCALEYDVEERLFLCPGCGRLGGEVLAGEELALVELEGE